MSTEMKMFLEESVTRCNWAVDSNKIYNISVILNGQYSRSFAIGMVREKYKIGSAWCEFAYRTPNGTYVSLIYPEFYD